MLQIIFFIVKILITNRLWTESSFVVRTLSANKQMLTISLNILVLTIVNK